MSSIRETTLESLPVTGPPSITMSILFSNQSWSRDGSSNMFPSGSVALVESTGLPSAVAMARAMALSGTRIPAVFRFVSIILGTIFDPDKIKV